MEENPERRFRLRQGEKVVGFMRKVSNGFVLYSRDGFWWRGVPIPYDTLDEHVGLRDKNNRHCYEWDIVYYKKDPDADYQRGVILWEGREEHFGIKDIDDSTFIPLFLAGAVLFNPRQIEVFSYLFLNEELKKNLGVRDQK